jgi:hypothetical protein
MDKQMTRSVEWLRRPFMDEQYSHLSYYRFGGELTLPIFLRFNLENYSSQTHDFLTSLNFRPSTHEDFTESQESDPKTHILTINLATHIVAREIRNIVESTKHGAESIILRDGYRLYRYKNTGILIYSHGTSEWQLGTLENFATTETEYESQIVISRYLAWALAPVGIVGFWGVAVDDGAVVMNSHASRAEAVYFDIFNGQMITRSENLKMTASMNLHRLDPCLKGRNKSMSKEELYSFLINKTTYFDYVGPSIQVRQLVQQISKSVSGIVLPFEDFRPKTDLSI